MAKTLFSNLYIKRNKFIPCLQMFSFSTLNNYPKLKMLTSGYRHRVKHTIAPCNLSSPTMSLSTIVSKRGYGFMLCLVPMSMYRAPVGHTVAIPRRAFSSFSRSTTPSLTSRISLLFLPTFPLIFKRYTKKSAIDTITKIGPKAAEAANIKAGTSTNISTRNSSANINSSPTTLAPQKTIPDSLKDTSTFEDTNNSFNIPTNSDYYRTALAQWKKDAIENANMPAKNEITIEKLNKMTITELLVFNNKENNTKANEKENILEKSKKPSLEEAETPLSKLTTPCSPNTSEEFTEDNWLALGKLIEKAIPKDASNKKNNDININDRLTIQESSEKILAQHEAMPTPLQKELINNAEEFSRRRTKNTNLMAELEKDLEKRHQILRKNEQDWATVCKKSGDHLKNLLSEAHQLSTLPWGQQHKAFSNKLKNFIEENSLGQTLDNFIPSFTRDLEEGFFIIKYYLGHKMTEETKEKVKEFLLEPSFKTCHTLTQYRTEIAHLEKGLALFEYHKEFTEGLFLEMLRRAGVVQNLDAIAYDSSGRPTIYKASEGPTATANIYHEKFFTYDEPLTKEQKKEILDHIIAQEFNVRILEFPSEHKMVDNTQERHMNFTTTITQINGTLQPLIIGNPTSSADNNTIPITPKQYVNEDPKEQHKPQRVRIVSNPTKITQENITERFKNKSPQEISKLLANEKRFEEFFKSHNFEGVDVLNKIIEEAKKRFAEDIECRPKEPLLLDRKTLANIGKDFFKQKIETLIEMKTNKENIINSKDAISRQDYEERQEKIEEKKQRTQRYQAMKDLLQPEHKKILNIKEELEEKEKKFKEKAKTSGKFEKPTNDKKNI